VTAAEIREQVIESRRAQGLPDHVVDERFLADLARAILAPEALAARAPQGGGPDA
jgi:hypothetical protein